MKKYIKPEFIIENILIISPISSLSVNSNEAANYNNIETDSWDTWVDLFN